MDQPLSATEWYDRAQAALAREKRAYTLLVSVQPAARRATWQSPNDTALRLNKLLEDAIQEWVDEYLALLAEPEDRP
jgi:hypothetical protein